MEKFGSNYVIADFLGDVQQTYFLYTCALILVHESKAWPT